MEETKYCTKCGLEKSSEDFSSFSGSKDGLQSWCRLCKAKYARKRRLERYEMSAEQYLILLEKQGGRCAICGKVPDSPFSLCIDHDHSCCPGKTSCGECIRGLLCGKCNAGLGMFDDNCNYLLSAVDYLG